MVFDLKADEKQACRLRYIQLIGDTFTYQLPGRADRSPGFFVYTPVKRKEAYDGYCPRS
jgi:hypothetical protein